MVRTRSNMPDYYAVLDVSPTATATEIRSAYKKRSLSCHPDIDPTASKSEKERKTKEFQEVADAYYILSDASRKKTYDNARKTSTSSPFFSSKPNNNKNEDDSTASNTDNQHPDPEETFASVFEDLLTPEVHKVVPIWTIVGAASGAAIGFIIANIPGAVVGGFGGSRLGAIRDAKGKAVYQVFQELGGDEKAAILRSIALKVLGTIAT